jgi:6-phosphogluconolactonase
MAHNVIISETPETLAERVAQDFAKLVTDTLANKDRPPNEPADGRRTSGDRFAVALAGGSTPKQTYARLAKEPYKSSIPWAKLWFFWGDERCVPKEHADSNFRMAAEALLQYIPVPPSHVIRMRGEDPPPQAAQEYEKFLRSFFRDSGLWPRFDLIFLGMGQDGHTASLVPGTPAVANHVSAQLEERRQPDPAAGEIPQPRWVVHNVIRSMQTVRITLTYPVINQAKNIWFLLTGAKKAAVFAEVQKGPNPQAPASLVQPVDGALRWYVDKEVVYGRSKDPSPEERTPISQRRNRSPGQ